MREAAVRIECSECEMYQSSHCDDCLVTALLHPIDGPVEIDNELDGPLQSLSGAGLIPVLRFRPRRSNGSGAGEDEAETG